MRVVQVVDLGLSPLARRIDLTNNLVGVGNFVTVNHPDEDSLIHVGRTLIVRDALTVAASVLATAVFWVTMLTSPPTTVADPRGAIDVYSIGLGVPEDLPEFEHQYRRHTGMLDPLP